MTWYCLTRCRLDVQCALTSVIFLAVIWDYWTSAFSVLSLLWPPKARPLYFTAVSYSFFVSLAERPAMGSQPNLTTRSEMPLHQIRSTKNHQILTTFFVTSALDTAYLRKKTLHRQTKIPVLIYNVSPKSWPTFRDLYPEKAEMRCSLQPTHENSAFFHHCRASHARATETRPI